MPPGWTTDDINVNAKETCRNWFYKISSIREILPRLYMEMCLLSCYRFLSTNEYPQVLGRIASMIRGIGDPVVALYAQCYLARCGGVVCRDETNYANTMVYDYLYGFKEYETKKFSRYLKGLGVSLEEVSEFGSSDVTNALSHLPLSPLARSSFTCSPPPWSGSSSAWAGTPAKACSRRPSSTTGTTAATAWY